MSRIRANQITNQSADGAPTVQNGLVISGVTTSTTFSGSGASLTSLPAANLTGTLPAISGANLTSLPAQATIANNADNRVITGGSGVNLNGEANLTYNGSILHNQISAGARNDFSTSADGLIIEKGGSTGLSIDPGSSGTASIYFPNESNHSIASITHNNSTGELRVRGEDHIILSTNSNTERLRITSDGQTIINGTTNLGHPNMDDIVVGDGTGNRGITIASGTSNYSSVAFGDSNDGSGADRYEGLIEYFHNDDSLTLYTAHIPRLRIDSNGKVSIASGAYGGGGTVPELYVKGTSGRQMKIHNSNAGTSSLQITNGTTGEGEDAGTQLFTQGSTGDFYISNQYASGDIAFNTRPSGGSNTKRLTIDSNGYVTHQDGKKCAFNVKGTAMTRNNTNAYVCTFDNDTSSGCFDSGNNFNTSTYEFTAPVSGYYYFFANIRLDSFNSGYIRTAILSTSYHAGTSYWSLPSTGHVIDYYHDPSNLLHISTSTVMYMPATHKAWVYQNPNSDSSFVCALNESSFGGYFIG